MESDLELQLDCYLDYKNTFWPESVQIFVNWTPVCIDEIHKPLYLTDLCKPGRNIIHISVTACSSHMFVLRLVRLPLISSVIQNLVRMRLLPASHCVNEIKRNFTSLVQASTRNGGEQDDMEQTTIKISLKCPISLERITVPVKGQACKHVQCIDAASYMEKNFDQLIWKCPVCYDVVLLDDLDVDQYFWGILTNLRNTDVEEVLINDDGSWTPVPLNNPIREERDIGETCPKPKRFKRMSINSMTLPTTRSWEMDLSCSLLATPNMQALTNHPIANVPFVPIDLSSESSGSDFHSQASDSSRPFSLIYEGFLSITDPLGPMKQSLVHHEQSHLFLLKLGRSSTVSTVLNELLRKCLSFSDDCSRNKIKRIFTSIAPQDGVELTAIKVSYRCPITWNRIKYPARGRECKHVQVFDLESYLQVNISEQAAWRCPVCNKPAYLADLEVDEYIQNIFARNLKDTDVEEIIMESTGSWIPIKSIKKEL